MNKTYYIEYTESGSATYQVQYKSNSFFEDEWIGPGQSYVSSLIKQIQADFDYTLNMDTSEVGFDYTYGVVAQLIVSDKTTGDHIFDPTDVILPETTVSLRRTSSFTIDERVLIDFGKYDAMADRFIDSYSLKNATAMLVVTMNVEVLSSCDEFEDNNENSHSVSIVIPLGEQNFSIHSTEATPSDKSKVLACKGAVNQDIFLTTGISAAIIDAVLGIALALFVYLTRNEDVNYTNKVRKLLNAYRSFIQQIDGEFDSAGYQVVAIKTFNEMLGIRDTIQSPILMSENRDQTRTQFLIPTNTRLLYLFEIKVDNYDEIYTRYEEEPHSTVLAFEDEQGVEEAIIIEENVSLEDIAEAMATPDVVLDEVDYVADDDVDYEGTEDAPGVEVVGVVWPEKTRQNKVYRYDPNGESLHEGDMVLVPTRDAAREREVIRKAAIAHANHTIDPSLHPHPLKKIIGIIKRRAEAALAPEAKEDAKVETEENNEN